MKSARHSEALPVRPERNRGTPGLTRPSTPLGASGGFLLFLLLAACAEAKKPVVEAPAAAPSSPSSTTRWVKVRLASDLGLLDAPARVLPAPQGAAALSSPLIARVVRVRVRHGQLVAAGEPLLDVLMPEAVQAAGALAAANLKVEAWARREAQLQALKVEGLARATELAEVEALLAGARADAQFARATLRAAGIGDKQADALLQSDGTVSLRSPIAGVVTDVDARLGEVREPAGKPLVEVAGESEGLVEARMLTEIVSGVPAQFIAPDGIVVPLMLVSLSPRVETRDGARLAWFKATSGTLFTGTAGRVRLFPLESWRAVPAQAVGGDGAGAHVFVRVGEKAVSTPVKLVERSGAEAIVEGLAVDAEVAADAAEVRR